MTSPFAHLSPRQQELLDRWLPGAVLEREHNWGLVDRAVLEVTHGDGRFIVKAGGADDHHMDREIDAHERWLEPWAARSRAPRCPYLDRDARLVVTHHLPGRLVLGTDSQDDPAAYRQAGELLALLHNQAAIADDDYEGRENAKSLAWLDRPHRIAADAERRLRAEIASWPMPPAELVPTHGDWQPRNWLVHEGLLSIIDFGRAALRPAMTDLLRLDAQDFRRDPRLEEAFLEGYGSDPCEPGSWRRHRVREAIGTAVWAHQVGDESFEEQGHRMIADALAASPGQSVSRAVQKSTSAVS